MSTINRNSRAWLDDFMRHATAEMIRDLLVEINDHLQSRHTWLDDAPLTDLHEQITEVEDAIFCHENSPVAEAEKRAEWAERRAEERRDEAMVNEWEKDHV